MTPRDMIAQAADILEERSLITAAKALKLSASAARMRQISRIVSDRTCEEYIRLCQREGLLDANGEPSEDWGGTMEESIVTNSTGGEG